MPEDYEDFELSAEEFQNLRIQFSTCRKKFQEQNQSLSLAEQRKALKRKLEKFLFANDFEPSLINSDELKALIEEYLYYGAVEHPDEVHAENWVPWLNDARKKSISWEYSNRYFQYLTGIKRWTQPTVSPIDIASDDILNHCGDPKSNNDFTVKGLVVGDIQSGKTASYTSLINKAIDAGYKIIVVLTGTTNDLRSQTQKRLDKEVAGFKTDFNDDESGDAADDLSNGYGVGQIAPLDKLQVLTNASINGDLKKNIGLYQVNAGSSAFLAVIKKNKSSLNAFISFLKKCQASQMDPDKKMPFPVLMIDDEADLASVNTSKSSELSESTGTNKLIRTILFKTCRKFTYVGYTATPFANVFIKPHDQNLEDDDADDIFPDDFIITLKTPDDYCGPKAYFGIDKYTEDNDENVRTDLLVPLDEQDVKKFCGYQDPDQKSSYIECVSIPQSLRDAVMCFLISSGAKISRGIIENYTMLVNVNVRVKFNETLHENVKSIFENACKTFMNSPEVREKYHQYWLEKMYPISQKRLAEVGLECKDHWGGPDGIEEGIRKAIKLKKSDSVKLIVGTSSADVLDYSKSKQGIFVCVGGQKLSRGLTLEGLSVSYYGRHAQAMDTLLQMGRWFGYRKGWLDLCRVFTTKQIADDYIDAAITVEGFKKQIEEMDTHHATPRTFGLRVQIANEKLKPTSAQKSRNALKLKTSFSAGLSQLLEFKISDNQSNLELIERFIAKNKGKYSPRKDFNRPVFRGFKQDEILKFLRDFKSPQSTIEAWRDYIKRCNDEGELKDWTVILSTTDSAKVNEDDSYEIAGYRIGKAKRSKRLGGDEPGILKVRALTSPKDYVGFFPDGVQVKENGYDVEEPNVKKYYTPDKGILVIYVVDIRDHKTHGGAKIPEGKSIAGLAIWFPKSRLFKPEYSYANPVEIERIYNDAGTTIVDDDE